MLSRMDAAFASAAQATREHGLSRAGAYRNARTLSERIGDRLLVVDGRAVLDPEELVGLLRELSGRAEQAERALAAAQGECDRLAGELHLARHEQELERDRAAQNLTALSEIVDRASSLMRDQVVRVNSLRT